MRSDTGQCLGVRQIQLHCTELVLYANTKLTCEELPGPDGGMRPQLRLVEMWVGLRVCGGEWFSGDSLRCYVSCERSKVIHERCQWSTDSIVSVHVHRLITAVNYIYTPKIVNLQCEMLHMLHAILCFSYVDVKSGLLG